MGRLQSFAVAAALPLLASPTTAAAQSPCGSEATVAEGENLADVADRCDVSLSALLDANPDLRTTEVPAGTEVAMPAAPSDSVLDRASEGLKRVGRDIEEAATNAGQSVSEYLSSNPDLNRDILEWGEWIGLPGVSAKPQVGADVTVTPATGQAGDEIVLRATGLRGDTDVRIGAGAPDSDFEMFADARTTRNGELEETIVVPQWAANRDALVFIVDTGRVRLVSEPFDVVPQ